MEKSAYKSQGRELPNRRPGAEKEYRNNQNGRPYQKRSGGYFPPKDKDEEEPRRRSAPRNPDKEKKVVEQPEKQCVINRLEKEKKAMQKKEMEKKELEQKEQKQPKPSMKVKRIKNIDWTREYDNDAYDDDEMYF